MRDVVQILPSAVKLSQHRGRQVVWAEHSREVAELSELHPLDLIKERFPLLLVQLLRIYIRLLVSPSIPVKPYFFFIWSLTPRGQKQQP